MNKLVVAVAFVLVSLFGMPGLAAAADFNTGVSGDVPLVDGTMTFSVPASAPDTLYYNCQNHDFMFGQINIVSAAPSRSPASTVPALPDFARGLLVVTLGLLGVALAGRALTRAAKARRVSL